MKIEIYKIKNYFGYLCYMTEFEKEVLVFSISALIIELENNGSMVGSYVPLWIHEENKKLYSYVLLAKGELKEIRNTHPELFL